MIYIKNDHIRIQVSKVILEEVLSGNRFHLELNASKHWRKELIDVELKDDKLVSKLREINTISISNGLHPDLPVYKYNCIRYFLSENGKFIFQLGDKTADSSTSKKEQDKPAVTTQQLKLF